MRDLMRQCGRIGIREKEHVRPYSFGRQSSTGNLGTAVVRRSEARGSHARFKLSAKPNILSSQNKRRPQRRWIAGKCGGHALHPINSILAYLGFIFRLSIPAECRTTRASAAWENGIHDR